MSAADDFDALFAPEDGPTPLPPPGSAWQVLLVDDEPAIHAVLHLALQDMVVEGHALQLIDAHSGEEARRLLALHPDIALVLLDVVMETEHAGLDLVRHLRQDLDNHLVQIILVTGQPGYAPSRQAVVDYEINGYRLKSELNSDKIFVSVYTALRTRQRMVSLVQQQQHLAQYRDQLEQLVEARTAALEMSTRHLAQTQFAMDRAGIAIAWVDVSSGAFVYVNDEASRQLGYTRQELLSMTVKEVNPEAGSARFVTLLERLGESDRVAPIQTRHRRKDGSHYPAEVTLYRRVSGGRDVLIMFSSDITAREQAAHQTEAYLRELELSNRTLEALNARLLQAQAQLLQSEKMASIGQLAAGIAHEINNPVGYVKSNLNALQKYVNDFMQVLDAYAAAEVRLPGQTEAFAGVHRLMQQIDLGYERDDVGALLKESVGGLERVAKIVLDLKNFARADQAPAWTSEDLHQGLESTINVVWNQIKYSCELRRAYGELPAVQCVLPQLNQVFMNLLVNAAQAIAGHGTITLATGRSGEQVWVEVADTGRGIAPGDLQHIFDPFFTTKPVGSGTGLGLSISYSIVQKHHGRIEVHSAPGQGARFRVWLPIRQPEPEQPPIQEKADG